MDFTQMPVSQGYKYILVMTDTFTGWIEVFPTDWEGQGGDLKKKKLLHEIIPRFGLPRSLQSDNGTYKVTSKVIQGVSKALGITYYLLSPLYLKSSVFRKSRKSQPILKISDKKVTQETYLGWKEALPIALLHTHIAPKEHIGLNPYEMVYGRPFVYVFLDPEAQTLRSYTMAIGQFQQDIRLWSINQEPKDSK